jgi:hypothetical protein
VNDVAAVVLFLVLPAVAVGLLVLSTRSTTWTGQHPLAAQRLGLAGGGVGLAVAAFWLGRLVRWW